jgi:hypothetical protein
MSDSDDKSTAEEAAALLKALEILWNAMPDDAKERVRQEHPDVADAAEDVANLVRKEQNQSQSEGQEDQADS